MTTNQFKEDYPVEHRVFTFSIAKNPFGIDRRSYKGKGRPRKEDYYTGMIGSSGTSI